MRFYTNAAQSNASAKTCCSSSASSSSSSLTDDDVECAAVCFDLAAAVNWDVWRMAANQSHVATLRRFRPVPVDPSSSASTAFLCVWLSIGVASGWLYFG